jgi:chorismate mutase
MSNPKIPKGQFYIGFKDNFYKVDPAIFAQQSGKFAREFEGKSELEFEDNVSDETFKAFLSSCQLRNFQIKPLYALELLNVAREWECPNLETYCQDLCKSHGIVFRPRNDLLGVLLTRIDEGKAKRSDLQNVADVLDDYLEDDRLSDLEPEILFRIVLMAEKKGFSMEKYIKFVMSIIKTEPETATLLSLRINFDLLPEDQENLIFHCPTIHEMSIGFFVAMALSNVRWHGKHNLAQAHSSYTEVLNNFVTNIEEKRRKLLEEFESEHEKEMDEIITVLEKQHQVIEDLSDILAEQAMRLEKGPLSVEGQSDENINKMKADIEEEVKRISEVVNARLLEDRPKFKGQINDEVELVKNRWIAKMTDPEKVKQDHQEKLEDIKGLINSQEEQVSKLAGDVKQLKAALCAKIVRDKLRGEKGKRNISNCYGIFDESAEEGNIWGVDSEDVSKASKEIIDVIEQRLDEECPIRKPVLDDDETISTH